MSAEAENIRRAIRAHTIRRNTRELGVLMATIYSLCGLAACATFF